MSGRILAVCDTDQNYVTALVRRIGKQKSAGLKLYAFTGTEPLLEYARKAVPDLLLINEALSDGKIFEKFQGRVALLTEERPEEEGEAGAKNPETGNPMRIYKYQAASALLRQVQEIFSKTDRNAGEKGIGLREGELPAYQIRKPKTDLIGIYSPLGRCGKTSFALALAFEFQRTRPTLFLSFEIFSGWRRLYPEAKHVSGSLADGIYYLRNGNLKIAEKLLAGERKMGELSYLPPFPNPQDLLYVTDEEWKCVLDSIRYETGFETVVADLGIVPSFCPAILLNFPRIYFPTAEDGVAQSKLREFEDYVRENLLDTEMKERMREIRIPAIRTENAAGGKLLLSEEMKNFAAAVIQREHL